MGKKVSKKLDKKSKAPVKAPAKAPMKTAVKTPAKKVVKPAIKVKVKAAPVKVLAKTKVAPKAAKAAVVAKKVAKPAVVAKKPVAAPKVVVTAKAKDKKVATPVIQKGKELKKAKAVEVKGKAAANNTKLLAKEKDMKHHGDDDVDDHDDLEIEVKTPSKKEKGAFHFTEKMKKDVEHVEDKIKEQLINLKEYFQWKDIEEAIMSMEIFLPKGDECMERSCENIRTSGPYCRYHYIYNWKQINRKKEILKEGKLQTYIEELISKYPQQYIQMLIDDLSDEREFNRVLTELNISDTEFEIEESEDVVDEEADDMDFEPRSIDSFKAGFDDE